MRLFLFVVLSICLASWSFSDWREIKSYKGKFRVLAPAEMTEKIDSIETSLGKIAYHTFFHQSENKEAENLFYMVSFCEYPEGSIHSDSTDLLSEFFETTIQSATESVDGSLIYTTEINLDNYPGKFWRIEYFKGQVVIKTKAFIVENRYYALQTIAMKDKSLNPLSEQFFNSFKLLTRLESKNE